MKRPFDLNKAFDYIPTHASTLALVLMPSPWRLNGFDRCTKKMSNLSPISKWRWFSKFSWEASIKGRSV